MTDREENRALVTAFYENALNFDVVTDYLAPYYR
jgi:hypothetical protein